MRIALIYRVNYSEPQTIGVQQKQSGQHQAFLKLGYECDSYYHRDGSLYRKTSDGIEEQLKSIPFSKNQYNLKDFFTCLDSVIFKEEYDHFYIRYPIATRALTQFLKNQRIPTTIEVPTYPYLSEWRGLQKLYTPIVKHYESKLKNYCRYIVHFGDEKTLFGIPTIRISNGINIDHLKPLEGSSKEGFKMIAVGNFNYWHGLDRVIKGLAHTKKHDIDLMIIGDVRAVPQLKQLVLDYKVEDSVSFYPVTYGETLDRMYNMATVAIGTLGIHRKNVKINASLKHREYTLRGVPFIYSGEDKDFSNCSFAKRIADDDSPIDIEEIRDWRLKLTMDKTEIYDYAVQNLSWESKLKAVVDKWERD